MVRRVEVVSMDMMKATVLATGKLTCRKVDWVVWWQELHLWWSQLV